MHFTIFKLMKVLWGDVMRIRMYFMQEEIMSGTENHRQGLKSLGLNWWHHKRCLQAWMLRGGQKSIHGTIKAHCFLWNLRHSGAPRCKEKAGSSHIRLCEAGPRTERSVTSRRDGTPWCSEAWIPQPDCLRWNPLSSCVTLGRLLTCLCLSF